MARMTITLPKELIDRLKPLKHRINYSEVCRTALEARVVTYEQIQQTLSQEDVMKKLVDRLKIQRSAADKWSFEIGRIYGQTWAINYASYEQLRSLAEQPTHEFTYVDFPYPDDEGAAELLKQVEDHAHEIDEYLNSDTYARGFADAACEVWEKVKPELNQAVEAD